MSRTLLRVMAVVFLVAGVAGFVDPMLFGLHLTPVHNAIHILSGLLTLYVAFAGSNDAVRGLGLTFGMVYALLGVLGFVAPQLLGLLLGHEGSLSGSALAPDNVLHLLIGSLFVLAGALGPASRRSSTVTRLDLP